jgi:predicted nucleic acid-binding protein
VDGRPVFQCNHAQDAAFQFTDFSPESVAAMFLPIESRAADSWGRVLAAGQPLAVIEAFIAGTAVVHGLTLVTRNESHFQPFFKNILNPWTHE